MLIELFPKSQWKKGCGLVSGYKEVRGHCVIFQLLLMHALQRLIKETNYHRIQMLKLHFEFQKKSPIRHHELWIYPLQCSPAFHWTQTIWTRFHFSVVRILLLEHTHRPDSVLSLRHTQGRAGRPLRPPVSSGLYRKNMKYWPGSAFPHLKTEKNWTGKKLATFEACKSPFCLKSVQSDQLGARRRSPREVQSNHRASEAASEPDREGGGEREKQTKKRMFERSQSCCFHRLIQKNQYLRCHKEFGLENLSAVKFNLN